MNNLNVLNEMIKNASKEIMSATITHSNFAERRQAVMPKIYAVGNFYRDEARSWFFEALDGALHGAKIDWVPLAEAHTVVSEFFTHMEAATGLYNVADREPVFVELFAEGQAVPLVNVSAVREWVASHSEDELREAIRMQRARGLKHLVPVCMAGVQKALSELKFHKWDRDEEQIVADNDILGEIMHRVAQRASRGREGAQKVVNGEITGAIALHGSVGALCNIVLKRYGAKLYGAHSYSDNLAKQAESAYVLHQRGGASRLVSSKDGDREGMATGRNSTKDQRSFVEEAIRLNELEVEDFCAAVEDAMQPITSKLGELPIAWDDSGVTFTIKERTEMLFDSIRQMALWVAEQERRGESTHDLKVKAQFELADNVTASFDKEAAMKSVLE